MSRGMMKWAPYQSLVEQPTALAKQKLNDRKIPRPVISQDVAAEINKILTTYNKENLRIKFYDDGFIYVIESKINFIDINNKKLILDDYVILFKNILFIEEI